MYYKNCAPVVYRNVGGNPHWQVENRPFLGTGSLVDDGNGTIQGLYWHNLPGGRKLVSVRGGGIYTDGSYTSTNPNSSSTTFGFCETEDRVVAIERGSTNSYLYVINTNGATVDSTTTLTSTIVVGDPVYLDGYVFFIENDLSGTRQRIFNTTYGSVGSVDLSNDYLDAEQYPDSLVTLSTHKNHVVAFGKRSIEFFYDAGNALGSPLARNTSYSVEIGCHVPTLNGVIPLTTKIADDVYFISSKTSVGMGVYRIKNFGVEKVSDTYLDKILNHMNDDYESSSNQYPYPTKSYEVYINSIYAYNEPCIMLQWAHKTTGNHQMRYFVFQPSTGIWSEWEFAASRNSPRFITFGDPNQEEAILYTTDNPIAADDLYTASWFPAANGRLDETIQAEITTDYLDFDSYYNKHYIFADVLGKFDSQDTYISLCISKNTDQYDYIDVGTKTGQWLNDGVPRFRNLGRARRMSFKIVVQTKSSFIVDGLDVRYEQGVY